VRLLALDSTTRRIVTTAVTTAATPAHSMASGRQALRSVETPITFGGGCVSSHCHSFGSRTTCACACSSIHRRLIARASGPEAAVDRSGPNCCLALFSKFSAGLGLCGAQLRCPTFGRDGEIQGLARSPSMRGGRSWCLWPQVGACQHGYGSVAPLPSARSAAQNHTARHA
jgi:hypothetical protein